MRKTSLILVDGLPGSGKSTTAQWLALTLEQRGVDACWYHEWAVDNPLRFLDWHERSPSLDGATPESLQAASLSRWEELAAVAAEGWRIRVFDSWPFLLPVSAFLWAGTRHDQCIEYAREVTRIAAPLEPVLVYFQQSDAVSFFRAVCEERGRAFQRNLVAAMERFPYFRDRRLQGFAGALAFVREYESLRSRLLAQVAPTPLCIENSAGDWPAYRARIRRFLGLDEPRCAESAAIDGFCGGFSEVGGARELEILQERGRLWLVGLERRSRLLRRSETGFLVEGLPTRLEFELDGRAADGVVLDERWRGGTLRAFHRTAHSAGGPATPARSSIQAGGIVKSSNHRPPNGRSIGRIWSPE